MRVRIVLPFFASALLAGCMGGASLPQRASGAAGIAAAEPHSISWGVGLGGLISGSVPKGLAAKTFSRTFCQNGKKIGCPPFSLGKREYTVSLGKSIAWSGGSFTAHASGTSKLGELTFDPTISTTSNSNHISQSVAVQENFQWIDQLNIKSSTMPVGTKGSFKVTTTLQPQSVKVPCNADAAVSVTFNFSSNGLPGGYSSIYGGCVKNKFKYYIDKPTHPGTVIVATISGQVGQALNIQGVGRVQGSLCAVVGCVPQSATLKGVVTYKIESLTHGITFTTDSGTKY